MSRILSCNKNAREQENLQDNEMCQSLLFIHIRIRIQWPDASKYLETKEIMKKTRKLSVEKPWLLVCMNNFVIKHQYLKGRFKKFQGKSNYL